MLKSDYILTANTVYHNLITAQINFEKEYKIINYVKCHLLKNEVLDSFVYEQYIVNVFEKPDGFVLYVDDLIINITTYNKQIINYSTIINR